MHIQNARCGIPGRCFGNFSGSEFYGRVLIGVKEVFAQGLFILHAVTGVDGVYINCYIKFRRNEVFFIKYNVSLKG